MLIFAGYLILLSIIALFIKRPYYGIILTFLTKPIIDMFWESKYYGYISPLFIAAIVIPILAYLRKKSQGKLLLKSKHDKIIIGYLMIFAFLTVSKIIVNPRFTSNSIDTFSRIFSVTLFYFVGQYYFKDDKKKKQLIIAIIFSTIVPFFLTFFQVISGKLISGPLFFDQSARSAFFIPGRHNLQRISGVYEGVYELAFLGLFVALILIAMRFSRERFPLWGYPFLGLGIYFLYFTFSRSAWSLFIVSLIVFGLIRKKILFTITILIAAYLIYLMVPVVQYRFEDELGFIKGEKELGPVGYGRGNLWIRTWDDFNRQDIVFRMIGNYGLGNPENQFLGLLIWFGYIGLSTFISLIIYLSWQLWKHTRRIQNDNSFYANIRFLFIVIIIGGYWVAGLGNFFMTMISTQWVLWTWTGILLNDPGYRRTKSSSRQLVSERLSMVMGKSKT